MTENNIALWWGGKYYINTFIHWYDDDTGGVIEKWICEENEIEGSPRKD